MITIVLSLGVICLGISGIVMNITISRLRRWLCEQHSIIMLLRRDIKNTDKKILGIAKKILRQPEKLSKELEDMEDIENLIYEIINN